MGVASINHNVKVMVGTQVGQEIAELRAEAAEARALATTFKCDQTVRDLLNYAMELDSEAAQLEKTSSQPPDVVVRSATSLARVEPHTLDHAPPFRALPMEVGR